MPLGLDMFKRNMIIKFTSANKPSYIEQDYLLDDKSTGQQIIGYLFRDKIKGDIRINEGDYISIEGDVITIIPQAEYIAKEIFKDEIREKVGKDVIRILIKAIRTQVPIGSEKIMLVKLLTPVFTLLGDGFIQDARDMAFAEPTTTVYTAARKNFVVSEIDKGVALI